MSDDFGILNEREIAHLYDSPEDDVDMAAVRCVVRELRDRRARDLTAFERTVLSTLRDRIDEDPLGDRAMVAALDKILAGGG